MLKIENLSVYYGKIRALNNVSLEVRDGEIVSLIGANGAGKSTLIWTVAGCIKPLSGRITLDGKEIPPLPHVAAAMGIGLSPERRRLFPNLTVRENLLMGAFLRNDKEGIERDAKAMYELFPVLAKRKEQYAGTLSGGEQQMLAIARALMSKPKLLLLDEPSLGLSPLLTSEVFRKITEVNQTGVTVLLVEQNAKKALKVAHRAYVIEAGRITMEDSASKLLESDHVRRAYLGVRGE
ncbi:MAG TPA: ABC transporter ATP-binding protein [Firmicutes bacterium]|nr:ABC transporter ATP-binding protein [Bacillota bacterium]